MNQVTNFYEIFINSTQVALEKLLAFIPNLFAALLILIVGLLVAKIVKMLSRKFFQWIGINRLSRKSGIEDFLISSGYKNTLVDIFSKILFWSVFLLFLLPVSDILNLSFFADFINKIIVFLPNLIIALIIILIGAWAAKVISGMLKGASIRLGEGYADIVTGITNVLILIISFVIALSQLGIDTSILTSILLLIVGTTLLAFAIAFAIASKNVISNIIAGIYLSRNVKTGDNIIINEIKGKIIEIGSVTSTFEMENGKQIKVNNNSILQAF